MRDWKEVQDQASASGSQTQPTQAMLQTYWEIPQDNGDLCSRLSLFIFFLTLSGQVLQSSSH